MADIPHGELHVCASSFFNFECISYCCHNLTSTYAACPYPDPALCCFLSFLSDPACAVYLGCMSSNFSGTQFTMHDYRVHDPKVKNRRGPIHELGVVMYYTNVGGRVPNSLRALYLGGTKHLWNLSRTIN